MNTAQSIQNGYKVQVKNAQSGAQQTVDLPQGTATSQGPVRIKAKVGDKYQLETMSAERRSAPEQVKLKRVGQHLQVIFDDAEQSSLIIEDYYSIMPEGYHGVIGQAENGSLYEYVAEDLASTTGGSTWPADGQEMNVVLSGQTAGSSGAAVGVVAINPLLAALGVAGAAGAAAGGSATSTETAQPATVINLASSSDTGVVGDQVTRDTKPVVTGKTVPGAALVLEIKDVRVGP